jgi:hypothetical protein
MVPSPPQGQAIQAQPEGEIKREVLPCGFRSLRRVIRRGGRILRSRCGLGRLPFVLFEQINANGR